MKIAVPKESRENENRVALDPESCKKLIQAGMEISIEAGAGTRAFFPDDEYKKNGVSIVPGIAELLRDADFVLKVNSPGPRPDGSHEAELMKPGSMLLASIFPTRNLDAVKKMSVEDAKQVLTGADNSVTQFFTTKTREPLGVKFLPIVTRATEKVALVDKYNAVASRAASLGLLKQEDASIQAYVTEKALDGLYLMIGEEEKKIRADPIGTGSAILKKVFGSLK